MNKIMKDNINIEVPVYADLFQKGEKPAYLFWVGCAGAFDVRYKKVVYFLLTL